LDRFRDVPGEYIAQRVGVRFYPPGEDWEFLPIPPSLLFNPLTGVAACCSLDSLVKQFVRQGVRLILGPSEFIAGLKEFRTMSKTLRSQVVLALVVAVASAVSFAQSSGEATYKAKCQSCHGSAGVPNPGMAKMMGIKAVTDPDIKKLSVDEMSAAVNNGKGKMKPITGLTPAEVKDVVVFYKGLGK
jgi:mono/diheme cytochrome c family protein